jgi:hypothetical protein
LDLDLHNKDIKTFSQNISSLQKSLDVGIFRKRIAALMVTDVSMLICFGAVFPPLALVIALSVVKDVIGVHFSLDRYQTIMESIQDQDGFKLKELMLQLKSNMHQEILKAGEEIWYGVWYGVVMASWIWAFVLFDTLSTTQGVIRGLWVLVVMAMSPFILTLMLKFKNPLEMYKTWHHTGVEPLKETIAPREEKEGEESTCDYNPLVDNEIELRISIISQK